jgi:hypothetical protein
MHWMVTEAQAWRQSRSIDNLCQTGPARCALFQRDQCSVTMLGFPKRRKCQVSGQEG